MGSVWGDNQRLITIVAFGVAILIVGLLKLFRHNSADVNLHLTVTSENPNKLTLEQIMDALAPHTAKLKLLRLDETDKTIETAFLVEFKRIDDLNAAKDAIQGFSPTAAITFWIIRGILVTVQRKVWDQPLEEYRYERKFIVERLGNEQIRSLVRLHPAMFVMPYPPRWVNNIYLDTPELANYVDNVDGAVDRRKVRLRWYHGLFEPASQAVLEFKIKRGLVGRKGSI